MSPALTKVVGCGRREDKYEGMLCSVLLKGVPLTGGEFTIEEEGRNIGKEEVSRMLTDYIIQGQVMAMVMRLVDDEDGWNGPEYVAKHVYAIEFLVFTAH